MTKRHLSDLQPDEDQGFIRVTDVLDLHGFFPQQIPEVLEEFINEARRLGIREVRVIHGKGRSRLKYEVHSFLREDDRVEAFSDAPADLGGWGATLVLLKSIEQ